MKKQIKKRVTWGFNPVTRTVASGKQYKRAKEKSKYREYYPT